MLAYFGTDQSQVQRYLTGKSIGQSRLGLLFNAMAKVPVQFFILFIGAMVFVFFVFERPPLLFHPVEMKRVGADRRVSRAGSALQQALRERQAAARQSEGAADPCARSASSRIPGSAEAIGCRPRRTPMKLSEESDTNYIFLSFVTTYLPRGLVGLMLAVIFTAAMSASSGEINSLATVTMIDVYQRHFRRDGTDRHYLLASRVATVFWGLYAVAFANFAQGFGALIEAVNQVGSLFYGSMLGVFVLAFFMKRVGGTAAFWGVLAGQAADLRGGAVHADRLPLVQRDRMPGGDRGGAGDLDGRAAGRMAADRR